MRRASFEDMNCSVAQCLEVVGEWWSLLIVRDAFLGVRRFDDFQADINIPRSVLSNRLAALVERGIVETISTRHAARLLKRGASSPTAPGTG